MGPSRLHRPEAGQADLDRLHFSDCVNNGGASQLFIDFSPSKKGKKGQILRCLHDPDELVGFTDSFDEYLQMRMDRDYDFINGDTEIEGSVFRRRTGNKPEQKTG